LVPDLDTPTESTTDPPPPRSAFPIATPEQDEGSASGFREGLPETYRSRHDAHYVEALTAGLDGQPVRMLLLTRIDAPPPPDNSTLGDLARSIAEFGLLQPLLVRPSDGRFCLIAGRRRLAAARLAGLTAVPCLVHAVSETRALLLTRADNLRDEPRAPVRDTAATTDLDEPIDPRTAMMIGELENAMESGQACLRQMSTPEKTRERVALLTLAELARAEWLLRARQYLGATDLLAHARLRGVALIDDVKRAAGAVISLRGGTLDAHAVRGRLVVHGDSTLLSTAIVGLAWALFALGERVRDARVLVRLASPPGGGGPVPTVTQPSAVLVGRVLSRFFESSWPDRPGGAAAELAARLARQTAALHGAHLDVSSRGGLGTRVTMTFTG
jgi:ParB-like chromosome segregation protein Spo0J